MDKMTAVEWVIEQLLNTSYLTQKPDTTVNGLKVLKILNQAKEMEKNNLNIARLDGINLANKGYGK
jgi:hypothetical protein